MTADRLGIRPFSKEVTNTQYERLTIPIPHRIWLDSYLPTLYEEEGGLHKTQGIVYQTGMHPCSIISYGETDSFVGETGPLRLRRITVNANKVLQQAQIDDNLDPLLSIVSVHSRGYAMINSENLVPGKMYISKLQNYVYIGNNLDPWKYGHELIKSLIKVSKDGKDLHGILPNQYDRVLDFFIQSPNHELSEQAIISAGGFADTRNPVDIVKTIHDRAREFGINCVIVKKSFRSENYILKRISVK